METENVRKSLEHCQSELSSKNMDAGAGFAAAFIDICETRDRVYPGNRSMEKWIELTYSERQPTDPETQVVVDELLSGSWQHSEAYIAFRSQVLKQSLANAILALIVSSV